jgi:hypothetical protein
LASPSGFAQGKVLLDYSDLARVLFPEAYLDDLIIVPLGIITVVKLIPPEVIVERRSAAALTAERPVSRTTAVTRAFIWIASIALTAGLGYLYFVH